MMQPTSLSKAVARTLRGLRSERLLTQAALAGRTGLDRGYLSGLERGLHQPTLETMVRLAAAFGIRATDLMSRIETANGASARRGVPR